jgi:hypothetical protein
VRVLSTLLTMVTTKNTLIYAKTIEKDCGKYPEVNSISLNIG